MENEKVEKLVELLKSLYIYLDSIKQTNENGIILYDLIFNKLKIEEKILKEINQINLTGNNEKQDLPQNSNKQMQLIDLISKIKNCNKCELSLKRINTVPGAGPIDSKVMIVGEGPGEQEDIQGLPFVGRAGQLLTKLLENSSLEREKIYITNCVKCRPPNNRVPSLMEMNACSQYLSMQINLIKPQIIICLGATSTQFLLQKKVSITKIRGTLIETEIFGHKLFLYPIFHPSFLLRDPRNIEIAQKDFNKIANYLKKNNIY
jgi:DNA polymerase